MTLLVEFLLPVAVLISAAATSATAVFAYHLWQSTTVHDRVLFGDDDLHYPGLVDMVNAHRRIIKHEHDLKAEELYGEE